VWKPSPKIGVFSLCVLIYVLNKDRRLLRMRIVAPARRLGCTPTSSTFVRPSDDCG
jgi:hypothetical protein